MSTKATLALGLTTCMLAAVLMVAGVVGVGWGAAIGMIGLGLLSTSAVRRDGTSGSH